MKKKSIKEATSDSSIDKFDAGLNLVPRNWEKNKLEPFGIPVSKYRHNDNSYDSYDNEMNRDQDKIDKLEKITKKMVKRFDQKTEESQLNEDLGVWFGTKKKPKGSKQPKGPWVNICKKNKDGKHPPCGREEGESKAYPKCRAAGVAGKMSDKEKKAACAQKRRAEKKNPKVGKGNKPTMTSYKPKKKKNESLKNIIKKVLKEETDKKLNKNDYPSLWVIINSIIKHIEGGYYHPIMKSKNPTKYANMGNSGETLFGIDRKFAGKDLESQSEWRRFWSLVDADKRKNPRKWVYNYSLNDNSNLKNELRNLVIHLIKNRFRNFSNKFLTDETKQMIQYDPYIIYQLVYASYNGSGFFGKLANKLNLLVKNGKDNDDLNWAIRQWRSNYPNKIINLSADKIDKRASELSKNITMTQEPVFDR